MFAEQEATEARQKVVEQKTRAAQVCPRVLAAVCATRVNP